ncbi:MAG: hypothetical protein AAF571_03415 [Verrucomicrobiota bacterium]
MSAEHEEHKSQEQVAYYEAWMDMPEAKRDALIAAGVKGPDWQKDWVGKHSPDVTDSENPAFQEAEQVRADCDSEVDRVQEMFEVDGATARLILDWNEACCERAVMGRAMRMLHRVLGFLLSPRGDLAVMCWSLAFAINFPGIGVAKNGDSMNAKAEELGVTRSLLQNYKDELQELLGIEDRTHGKSDHHREACRSAQQEGHWQHKKGSDALS